MTWRKRNKTNYKTKYKAVVLRSLLFPHCLRNGTASESQLSAPDVFLNHNALSFFFIIKILLETFYTKYWIFE